MEHTESINTQAAERYLLDEMPDGERDAFEEHYFDCMECTNDVRDGARMMAAGRDVVRVKEFRPKPLIYRWLPQVAAGLLVGVLLGSYVTTQWSPQDVTYGAPIHILMEEERGPDSEPQRIEPGRRQLFVYPIPPRDEAVSYVTSIRDDAGKTWLSAPHSRDQAADPISLVVPALPQGNYHVVIEGVRKGGNRFPISKSPFEVVQERREEGQ